MRIIVQLDHFNIILYRVQIKYCRSELWVGNPASSQAEGTHFAHWIPLASQQSVQAKDRIGVCLFESKSCCCREEHFRRETPDPGPGVSLFLMIVPVSGWLLWCFKTICHLPSSQYCSGQLGGDGACCFCWLDPTRPGHYDYYFIRFDSLKLDNSGLTVVHCSAVHRRVLDGRIEPTKKTVYFLPGQTKPNTQPNFCNPSVPLVCNGRLNHSSWLHFVGTFCLFIRWLVEGSIEIEYTNTMADDCGRVENDYPTRQGHDPNNKANGNWKW